MRKRTWIVTAALAVLLALLPVFPAMAADSFAFEKKEISLFEGETAAPALVREGDAAEGTISWSSANEKTADVSAEGVITGLRKGSTTITARLKGQKKTWKASIKVNVLRAVTDVTLDTSDLDVYNVSDERVSSLLEGGASGRVILIPVGKSARLRATCTPSDASDKNVNFASSDEGLLAVKGATIRGVQAGQCELTVESAQNPEVQEVFSVIVVQPVTRIRIAAEDSRVFVGETVQLEAFYEPSDATVQEVTWSSRSPKIAEVDAGGLVTGLKRGTVVIVATAADGSGKTANITLNVEQKPTGIRLQESELNLVAGQSGQLHATVLPSDAGDKSVRWESSDPQVATVNSQGRVSGVRRGECTITAVSEANPALSASATVRVVQRVTAIEFLDKNVSLPVRTTYQLNWEVEPADATIQTLEFSSANKKIATVDSSGVVRGVSKGTVDIYAAATDGSNRRAKIRVQVTQPVEGMEIQYDVYHVQLEKTLNVKALISPSNANNIAVDWSVDDRSVASVKGDGKNVATVRGLAAGTTYLTGVTLDGGFSDTVEIRVADFDRAVVVDDVYLDGEDIRMTFRNRSKFRIAKVNFEVELYNVYQEPIVCHKDGKSNHFTGTYPLTLAVGGSTKHREFKFKDFVQPEESIAIVIVTITGWTDTEGYTRSIKSSQCPTRSYWRYVFQEEMRPVDQMELSDE